MTNDPMTNDDRQPHSSGEDPRDDVDLLVSRLVDGEIDLEQVPIEARPDVERRFTTASRLREMLRVSSVSTTKRDAHIAVALAQAPTTRARSNRQFASSRSRFAIAASLVLVVSLSTLALRQFGSGDDDSVVFDAMPMATEESSSVIAESTAAGQSNVDDDISLDTSARAKDSGADIQARTVLPEFRTADDIASFTTRGESAGSRKPGDSAESTRRCSFESRPVFVFEAIFAGIAVEVHVIEPGLFIVYDTVDCSVVLDRSTAENVTE